MSRYVLDASAVMAVIGNEPGAEVVIPILSEAAIGTVNLAEVHTKLVERGIWAQTASALADVVAAAGEIVLFDEKQAEVTGALRDISRHLGLGLGDRACLALGIVLGAEVYTTDGEWLRLDLPCAVRNIR